LNLDQLKVFQTVAHQGNLTKAAQKLNFVQSNVTAKIKQLEAELKTPLFYRHKRGVTLTSAGKTLLVYTDKITNLVEEARQAVQDTPFPRGSLTIGSMETTAAVRLPSLLAAYHKTYPEVAISLTTDPTEQLIDAVLNYQLDGAFVAGPVHHPEIIQETIFHEELFLVTDPLYAGSLETIASTQNLSMLVFRKGCSYRARLEDWLRREGMYPVKTMEFGSVEAIIGSVMAGMGVSLLPFHVIQKYVENGELIAHSLPKSISSVETVFIRRHDIFMSNALNRFIEIIRN